MASTLPPVKGAAFTFDIALVSQGDTDIFQTSVTLAAGDVTVSKDGGAFGNITSLPTEIGTSGVLVVALTTTEMNADRVTVLFHDAAGSEWQDACVTIYTAAQTLDTTDGVADGIKTKTDYLPSATAGAAGGVFIAGTNAATTITTALTTTFTGNLSGDVGGKVVGGGATVITGTGARVVDAAGANVAPASTALSNATWTDAKAGYLDAAVSSRSSHSAADVWSAGTRTLTSFGTLVADIWSYTTRTLTSLSALVSSIAASVWTYATRTLTSTAAATTAAVSGSTLTITAATTYSATLSGLTIPADWLDMWFTVKDDDAKTDAEAIIQIHKSNPADAANDGLVYLNAAAGTKADGSLTVDQAGGTVAITIAASSTDDLGRYSGCGYDVKVQSTAAGVTLLTAGTCNIELTETKTID